MRLETRSGRKLKLGHTIGTGGQGTVYRINGDKASVVKLYTNVSPKLETKTVALVKTPSAKRPSKDFAAWPTDLVFEISGPWFRRKRKFVGCVMPYVADSYPIFHFYTPRKRKEHGWEVNWGHMHRLAHNLALVFKEFHDRDLVIGDVNCRNILVNTDLAPTVIDIDSIQLSPQYTSDVGVEEYTPPELMGRSFRNLVRSKHHDLFGLGYLLFQVLMNGRHPFDGIPTVEWKEERIGRRCKELGIFPYFSNPHVAPPPHMPYVDVFHEEVQTGFFHCFIAGRKRPDLRPSATAWMTKLRTAERALVRCSNDNNHVHSSHLDRCPWC